jgi:IS5 family transposase
MKKRRDAFKITGIPGLFDSGRRLRKLDALGDPLVGLHVLIDWELFRTELETVHQKERKSSAGRKPIDVVLMFKIVVLQRLYNLSDDQAEYQIRDRASFQRFLGLHVEDGAPDAKTLWFFKERLKEHKLTEKLFALFEAHLAECGFAARGGQMVDAVFVEVPRQRNTHEENETIKAGKTPEAWLEHPHKLAQKDVDARWTSKRHQRYYGYKNHVNADPKHKLIRSYTVTDASVHDSQALDAILNATPTDPQVFADSAYRSQERETALKAAGLESRIVERAYRNRPLTEEQNTCNREKSSIRCRVEHVFGFMHTSMSGTGIRCIGMLRANVAIGLANLTYNISRYVQLQRIASTGPPALACNSG